MLGYTFRYQVFVYSCDSFLLSSFRLLFNYPSVQLFIMLFSYLMTAVYLVIILCTLFICTSFPLYTHTLTRSLSNDPGFARPDIGRFVSVVQMFVETVCFTKSWSFSLFDSSILILLTFLLFPDSRYIRFSCYSSLYLYNIMRGCSYVILQ